ncbi:MULTISPECIES: hypothetical protein [Streptomyces]|uniref:PadR family transcriptional regulator n=2 Tax=Streptomyces TaxID=1883 RepID=A0ABT9L5H0_9ACTN|nr:MULTISPECIES: hypothetical protein [Streptomyces]MBW8093380.1 hypothetical protein [Streptomyces hygroscopicus subsp. hygroscopicus]MDN3059498.1 hypothetical protein [Streptomyces sp. SRF1]MDP9615946.1 hypothetical protein [Streptomyces demainii]GHJ33842.1 hypothetical protein TPA0910_82750 [Streptomyces hygroscopicus]GLV78281.1 hypothetical protein Shyhy02_62810 [Streptomyces hygroscopicus subsp. hygroscopicus]
MTPAPKFQAAMTLYHLGGQGVWEHHLFRALQQHYRESELSGLREDLIGLSTVGWLRIVEQREHRGQILRRYALAPSARRLVEHQLDLRRCLPVELPAQTSAGEPA